MISMQSRQTLRLRIDRTIHRLATLCKWCLHYLRHEYSAQIQHVCILLTYCYCRTICGHGVRRLTVRCTDSDGTINAMYSPNEQIVVGALLHIDLILVLETRDSSQSSIRKKRQNERMWLVLVRRCELCISNIRYIIAYRMRRIANSTVSTEGI